MNDHANVSAKVMGPLRAAWEKALAEKRAAIEAATPKPTPESQPVEPVKPPSKKRR